MPGSRVLCLAGDIGAEAKLGRDKGFEVVGCDLQQESVDAFRKSGGIAVRGNFCKVAAYLHPEGAVFDAMGGLTQRSFWEVRATLLARNAFVWNGLRGRDKNPILRIEHLGTSRVPVQKRGRLHWTQIGLHRGKHAFVAVAHDWFFARYCRDVYDGFMFEMTEDRSLWREAMEAININGGIESVLWDCAKNLKPEFFTYPSQDSGNATLHYDSVAMNGFFVLDRSKFLKTANRKLAATKALLTMQRDRN
jgi:hypothetical protein